MLIDEQILDDYHRDGVVCLRGLFEPKWIEVLREGVERNLREPSEHSLVYTKENSPGRFWDDYCSWQRIDEYRDFVLNSPAAEIAGRLMQSSNVRIFHEHVLVKEPGTRDVSPWHQDQPYYCVDGRQVCSIWLPLDPVPQPLCVEFVAGSHNWDRLFSPVAFGEAETRDYSQMGFAPVPAIEADRDSYEILSWDLRLGDCIVFHMRTLHGAAGNVQPTTRRRAFATRWLGDDAVYAIRGIKTSPPFPELETDLQVGDPMDHPLFPIVWSS